MKAYYVSDTMVSHPHKSELTSKCSALLNAWSNKHVRKPPPNPGVPWPIVSSTMKGTGICPHLTPPECLILLKEP